jgi:hypothetical protein
MSPRFDREPETSVTMVAKKSRIMEGREAAGAGTKRRRFSAERNSDEAPKIDYRDEPGASPRTADSPRSWPHLRVT